MKRQTINTDNNNYIFVIEDAKGSLKSKGSNVFFALDILRNKQKIDFKTKIIAAYQVMSKTLKVDITAILLNS